MSTQTDPGLQSVATAAKAVGESNEPTFMLRDGRTVTVHKCKAKNLGTVLEFVTWVMGKLNITKLGEAPKIDLEDMKFMMELLMDSSDRVFHTASVLTSLDESEFFDLDLDEAVNLCIRVVALNKEFFVQSVLPLVQFALQQSPETDETKSQQNAKT